MKDFETDEEILGTYILITSSEGKSVTVSPQTFTKEIGKHLNYSRGKREGSEEEFYAEHIELKYEARDSQNNFIIRTPLFLPRHGRFFPKTIDFFLKQENIKIN